MSGKEGNLDEFTSFLLSRDRYQVNDSPSPIDDLLNQTPEAVKCQELTAVLRNLRKTERRLQGEPRVLFVVVITVFNKYCNHLTLRVVTCHRSTSMYLYCTFIKLEKFPKESKLPDSLFDWKQDVKDIKLVRNPDIKNEIKKRRQTQDYDNWLVRIRIKSSLTC